jgi:hypothetical protein
MKNPHRFQSRQSGFFAIGFALVLLAAFGTAGVPAVTVLEPTQQSDAAADVRATAPAPATESDVH